MDNVICTSFKTILKRTKTKLNRIYRVDKKRRLTTTITECRENDRRNYHQFNKTKRRTDKQMAAVSGATIEIIELKKKENGLGFNIIGGKGSEHIPGDCGVFVSKIKENGAAHNDGRLKAGDRILSVNGVSLIGKTHNEAVATFRGIRGKARMEIEPDAEQKAVSGMKKTNLTEVTVNSAAGPSPNINTSSSSLNAIITPKKTSPSTSQRSDTTSLNRRLEPASSSILAGSAVDSPGMSVAHSTLSLLDDVPRTPKKPLSYLDPTQSVVAEAIYVTAGIAALGIGIFIIYKYVIKRR